MKAKKSLKSALLMSSVSILLSGAMFAGTTFAWFTDEVHSGTSEIVAGNLKVEIECDPDFVFGDHNTPNWTDASEEKLFADDIVWEPGMMVISKPFHVVNNSSLPFFYEISPKFTDEKGLDDKKLSDVFVWTIVPLYDVEEQLADGLILTTSRDYVWAMVLSALEARAGDVDYWKTGELLPGERGDEALVMILYWMPSEADKDYNKESVDGQPVFESQISISVSAKQIAAVDEDTDGD